MIIFKDIFTGDELFSDIFRMELIDGVVYKLKGKLTTETFAIDEKLLGGNASAEGGEEGLESSNTTGVDIILNGELQEFSLDKKAYMKHIKEYMGSIKTRLAADAPDQVTPFMTNASKFIKGVLAEFSEYQLYCGKSFQPDGMLSLVRWEDVDGKETPFVYFFKHGLLEEKC